MTYYLISSSISFSLFFLFRTIILKRKITVFLYHLTLFLILFISVFGGSSVQNDAYKRFEEFKILEENNKLEYAKANLNEYDSMLQIDLEEFNNSGEFKEYLTQNDEYIIKAEPILAAWYYCFLIEICLILQFFAGKLKYKILDSIDWFLKK